VPAIWHNRNTVMPRRRAADGSPHIGSTHTQLIVISSAYGHGTGTRLRQADPFGRVRALPASAGTGRCPGFVTVTTGVRTVSRDWSGVTLVVLPHPATARWLRLGRDKLVSLTSDGEQRKRGRVANLCAQSARSAVMNGAPFPIAAS
jgi:hypothetical protein